MPARGAVALLALLLLSGCLGGGAGQGGEPTPSASPTGSSSSSSSTGPALPPVPVQRLDLLLAFDFVGCTGFTFTHSRPLEAIQALLPDGFTAAPPPGAPNGLSAGAVTVDLLRCGNLTTPAVGLGESFIGIATTYVERPLERVPEAPDAPVQEYAFRLFANDSQVLAVLWPAAGYDTYSGPASVETLVVTDGLDLTPGRAGTATVGSEYFLVAAGAGLDALNAARSQAFARYTVLDDGSVLLWTGTYALATDAAGGGTLEVADDDPFIGFASPGAPTPVSGSRPVIAGQASHVASGDVRAQDLRRLFT